MKQALIQLFAGLVGAGILVYGEYKDWKRNHPEIISTTDLTKHQLQPIIYYNYQVAYDPNNNKTWYLYGDGFWYDKPPQIRKHSTQSAKTVGSPNRTQGTQGHGNGQPSQTFTNTQRY